MGKQLIKKFNKILNLHLHLHFNCRKGPAFNIEVVCQFQVEKNNWTESLLKVEKHKVVLPIYFAEHLASIVASTTRGVLYANTKNTEFNKYPMNLINVHDILKGKEIEITI